MAFDFKNPWGGNIWGEGNHAYDRWFDGSEAAVGKKALRTNQSGLVEDHYYSAEGVFLRTESAGSGKIFIEGVTDSVKMLQLNKVQCENSLYEEVIKSWRCFYQLDLISSNYRMKIEKDRTGTFQTYEAFGETQTIKVSEDQIAKASISQIRLNTYLIDFVHEVFHVWQRTDKTQKHLQSVRYVVTQERELLAYTINYFPNKTSELRKTKFKIGVTAVFDNEVAASDKIVWTFSVWEACRVLSATAATAEKYASYIAYFTKLKDTYTVLGLNFDLGSKPEFLLENRELLTFYYNKSSKDI